MGTLLFTGLVRVMGISRVCIVSLGVAVCHLRAYSCFASEHTLHTGQYSLLHHCFRC